MISAIRWVQRGVAAEYPTKVDLDDSEMDRIAQMTQTQLEDAQMELMGVQDGAHPPRLREDSEPETDDSDNELADESGEAEPEPESDDDAGTDKYNMDNYDDEPTNADWNSVANVRGLAYHAPDEDDQYLTLPDEQELDEERSELRIQATDNLVLATKTEDDVSYLEVYVYDDASDEHAALYVHHDIMLPSFPLCVEWVAARPGESTQGSFAAIGTFEPEIELWDLDVVDGVYPTAILGQAPQGTDITTPKGTGKKKKKLRKANDNYHVDAVLSLAANPFHAHLLASGSADTTVKLWDLNTLTAVKSLAHHTSKVSSVAWNPVESTVLLSGGYDHYARIADLRAENVAEASRKYKISGDVENVRWHPNGQDLFVGSDQGVIYKFDARQEKTAVWTLQAHDAEITSFDINLNVDNYMVTGSVDKRVKLWNLSNDSPSMLLSRDLDVGKVFSVQFAPDKEVRGLISVAGSEGKLKVWNTLSNKTVRQAVAKNYTGPTSAEVTVGNDDDEESDADAMEDGSE